MEEMKTLSRLQAVKCCNLRPETGCLALPLERRHVCPGRGTKVRVSNPKNVAPASEKSLAVDHPPLG